MELRRPAQQSQAWKRPFQCKLHAWITKHNGTAHAIISMTFKVNFRVETTFTTSTPGHTLCEKAQGFVRFLTFKHHRLGEAISPAMCNHGLANHNTSASAKIANTSMKQPPWLQFCNVGRVRAHSIAAGSVAQTMIPTSLPGRSLSEKTKGFVRFLIFKHHPNEAIAGDLMMLWCWWWCYWCDDVVMLWCWGWW